MLLVNLPMTYPLSIVMATGVAYAALGYLSFALQYATVQETIVTTALSKRFFGPITVGD